MFDVTQIHKDDFVDVRLTTLEVVRGVVLNHGGDYVVVKEYRDFSFSAYLFIASKFVANIERVEPVDRIVEIVKSESMLEIDDEYRFLSTIHSADQLLHKLQSTNRVCIFHEDGEYLTLGSLYKLTQEHLFVQRIFTDFKYEQTYFRIRKNSVSMIELGSEYLRFYRDYSESPAIE